MGRRDVPQPHITLTILSERGGQSGVQGLHRSRAPELVVEVPVSLYSRDFGVKKRLYERTEVREYVIALPGKSALAWFGLTPGGFQALAPGTDGIYRSVCFPGLCLDAPALWELDLARINAVVQQCLATPEHAEFAAQLAARKG
jgi:Putative restriction endonuclease